MRPMPHEVVYATRIGNGRTEQMELPIRRPRRRLGCAGDVAGKAAAVGALERDVAPRRWGKLGRIALDISGAGGTAERVTVTVVGDKVQRLGRIERVRAGLAHYDSE